jgi:membrane-associated phospholipid phosphatase
VVKWADLRPSTHLEWRSFLVKLGRELAIVFAAALVYVVVRKMTEGSPERGVANARDLLRLEGTLGLRHEHQLQQLTLDHEYVRTFANWVYIWGHWPVIITVCIGLYMTHHANYVRMRNAIIVSGLIGFAFFALTPMAPPRLTPFGYVDTVTVWSDSYRVLQPPHYMNLYAAMPSLHFGWDLLVGLTLFLSVRNPLLRLFGLLMPMAMAFAVVATGNHWILDVIAGFIVVAVGAAITESWRIWQEGRSSEGAGSDSHRAARAGPKRERDDRSRGSIRTRV